MSSRGFALAMVAVTAACVVFYVSRDVVDRNYAGVSSGFRWMFWMIPAWLWLGAPALAWTARRPWARWAWYAALSVSVLSASLPWPNPWTHPWPYRLLMWFSPDLFQ
jgi:hypothetical protein